jgi:Meiotically up-regulated gene 113
MSDQWSVDIDKVHRIWEKLSTECTTGELDLLEIQLIDLRLLKEALPDGCVYVLQSGPFYKIGRAKRPDQRIKQLQIQLPFEVEVVKIIPCEDHVAAEKCLHNQLEEYRQNGEWFLLPEESIEWIKSIQCCHMSVGGNVLPRTTPLPEHMYQPNLWSIEEWEIL